MDWVNDGGANEDKFLLIGTTIPSVHKTFVGSFIEPQNGVAFNDRKNPKPICNGIKVLKVMYSTISYKKVTCRQSCMQAGKMCA
jgi:hypothetical protein